MFSFPTIKFLRIFIFNYFKIDFLKKNYVGEKLQIKYQKIEKRKKEKKIAPQ